MEQTAGDEKTNEEPCSEYSYLSDCSLSHNSRTCLSLRSHQDNAELAESDAGGMDDMDKLLTQDIGEKTMGAINEFHGHDRFDINKHVEKSDTSEAEDELLRSALNTVLHLKAETQRDIEKLARQISPNSGQKSRKKKYRTGRRSESPKSAAEDSLKMYRGSKHRMSQYEIACMVGRSNGVDNVQLFNDRKSRLSSKHQHMSATSRKSPNPKYQSDAVHKPELPPPLGYRWSFRQHGPKMIELNAKGTPVNIAPLCRWVLAPDDVTEKKKRSYNSLRNAKYGFRNLMDPNDFKIVNPHHFPPYSYCIIEPLRFPFHNFNSPPFQKRAPLYFTRGKFDDKIHECGLLEQDGKAESIERSPARGGRRSSDVAQKLRSYGEN